VALSIDHRRRIPHARMHERPDTRKTFPIGPGLAVTTVRFHCAVCGADWRLCDNAREPFVAWSLARS
jgi:hypothetical protein